MPSKSPRPCSTQAKPTTPLTVIIVAANASTVAGGEAMLPWQYFRRLRARGLDVHLVTHERNRANLLAQEPEAFRSVHFTPDRLPSRWLERLGRRWPRNIKSLSVWLLMAAITTVDLRRAVRELVRSAPGAVVVHEPVPVSPRQPSAMVAVGAPVVVGPLNGGMAYPDGFKQEVDKLERLLRGLLRFASSPANRLVDGKRRAAVVLVANDRTRQALPALTTRTMVLSMVENGVDLATFAPRVALPDAAPRFAFVGRLVDWKRVDLLLRAMTILPAQYCVDVVGAGPMRVELEALAKSLGLDRRATFHGQLTHSETSAVLVECDGLVLPSVYEAGGAVVLEAMAAGLPVVATDWGGPADYIVDGVTGFLIPPNDPHSLTRGIASAMMQLGEDRALGDRMGQAGRERVVNHFDWERKIDHMISIYAEAVNSPSDLSR